MTLVSTKKRPFLLITSWNPAFAGMTEAKEFLPEGKKMSPLRMLCIPGKVEGNPLRVQGTLAKGARKMPSSIIRATCAFDSKIGPIFDSYCVLSIAYCAS